MLGQQIEVGFLAGNPTFFYCLCFGVRAQKSTHSIGQPGSPCRHRLRQGGGDFKKMARVLRLSSRNLPSIRQMA